jgi:hypothetical protein
MSMFSMISFCRKLLLILKVSVLFSNDQFNSSHMNFIGSRDALVLIRGNLSRKWLECLCSGAYFIHWHDKNEICVQEIPKTHFKVGTQNAFLPTDRILLAEFFRELWSPTI